MSTSSTRPLRLFSLIVSLLVTMAMLTGVAGTAQAASEEGLALKPKQVAKTDAGKMTAAIVGKASDGSRVTGKFTPIKFRNKKGVPVVKGVINGVIKHPDGTKEKFTAIRTLTVKKINGQKLTAGAAEPARATCNVLNLVLGPLDLNVLGLEVHLKRVVLDVVASSGAGQLLGNLLCAVAGLLDGGVLEGLLGQLIGLLNQILGQLGLGA